MLNRGRCLGTSNFSVRVDEKSVTSPDEDEEVVERKPQVQKVEVHIESRLRVGGEDDVEEARSGSRDLSPSHETCRNIWMLKSKYTATNGKI